jgi:ribosomal protein S18 acetylase RimI-like enzyme
MSYHGAAWRIATIPDDEALVAMSLDLYREDPAPRPVPAEQTRRTLERFRAEPSRGRALVLEGNGRPLGYALLASFWSNELGGEVCTVDELFVKPEARGQGHGRRLLEELLRGGGALWPGTPVAFDLEVTPGNGRARAFYESLGFRAAKNAHLRHRP